MSYTRLQEPHRYPNLHEVRLIPTKKDIAFVEYMDEGSSSVAKDALHNYKIDGENKVKVYILMNSRQAFLSSPSTDHLCQEIISVSLIWLF